MHKLKVQNNHSILPFVSKQKSFACTHKKQTLLFSSDIKRPFTFQANNNCSYSESKQN